MADQLISPSISQLKGKSALHCCVPLCNSDSRYDNAIHFHKIPKDTALKKQWIIKIRRDEGEHFKIGKMTIVCSKHFKQEDYRSWTPVRKCLKPTAVPSVFDWTCDKLPRRALKRKILTSDSASEDVATLEERSEFDPPFIATPTGIYISEKTDEQETISKLKEELQKSKEELQKSKEENIQLQYQMEIERFCTNRFSNDDSCISFNTGFSSYMSFLTFFNIIEPAGKNMKSAYYEASETISLAGRKEECYLLMKCLCFSAVCMLVC